MSFREIYVRYGWFDMILPEGAGLCLVAKQLVKTCDDLMDPATNLRAGLEIWQVGTWTQWTTHELASNTLTQ